MAICPSHSRMLERDLGRMRLGRLSEQTTTGAKGHGRRRIGGFVMLVTGTQGRSAEVDRRVMCTRRY